MAHHVQVDEMHPLGVYVFAGLVLAGFILYSPLMLFSFVGFTLNKSNFLCIECGEASE
jgi:hypothetical protein